MAMLMVTLNWRY